MKSKQKNRIYLFLLLVSQSLICGCIAEYEEGPWISFRSHISRLHGAWDVKQLIVGGIDSTDAVKNQPCYQPIKFLYDDEQVGGTNIVPKDVYKCGFNGTYVLIKDCDYLQLYLRHHFGSNGIFTNIGAFGGPHVGGIKWEIIKLTNKELKMETDFNGYKNKIHLVKE